MIYLSLGAEFSRNAFGLYALGGIDDKNDTLTGGQRARDLITVVGVRLARVGARSLTKSNIRSCDTNPIAIIIAES